MFAGHGIDTLHGGDDATALTVTANLRVFFLHIARLWLQHKTADLEVGEACYLCFFKESVWQ